MSAMKFILNVKGIDSMTDMRNLMWLKILDGIRREYLFHAPKQSITEASTSSLIYSEFTNLTESNTCHLVSV